MRISYWSSDVCSSDLFRFGQQPETGPIAEGAARLRPARRGDEAAPVGGKQALAPPHAVLLIEQPEPREIARAGPDLARPDIIAVLVMLAKGDRKSAVLGKRVSVRVNLGGCR